MREIGRDQPLVLGTEKVQPTELREGPEGAGGAVDAAYLSPSVEATVSRGRQGVEVELST